MASSRIPGFSVLVRSERDRTRQCLQVRAHGYGDEGRSRRHIVDANMRLLKERMEEIKVKERLERCLVVEHGWNYVPIGDCRQKQAKSKAYLDFSELAAMVGVTFGLTILSCALCLCLASIVVHLNQ